MAEAERDCAPFAEYVRNASYRGCGGDDVVRLCEHIRTHLATVTRNQCEQVTDTLKMCFDVATRTSPNNSTNLTELSAHLEQRALDAETRASELEMQLEELTGRVNDGTSKVKEYEAKVAALLHEREAAEHLAYEKSLQVQRMEQRLSEASQSHESMQLRMNELLAENESMKRQLANNNKTTTDMSTRLSGLEAELAVKTVECDENRRLRLFADLDRWTVMSFDDLVSNDLQDCSPETSQSPNEHAVVWPDGDVCRKFDVVRRAPSPELCLCLSFNEGMYEGVFYVPATKAERHFAVLRVDYSHAGDVKCKSKDNNRRRETCPGCHDTVASVMQATYEMCVHHDEPDVLPALIMMRDDDGDGDAIDLLKFTFTGRMTPYADKTTMRFYIAEMDGGVRHRCCCYPVIFIVNRHVVVNTPSRRTSSTSRSLIFKSE